MSDGTMTADVVVVGFGGAGAAAALTAADMGARVVVLEKQPADRHTSSTSISAGIVMTANDVEAAARYLDRCAQDMVPMATSRVLAERATALPAWLDDLGLHLRFVRGAQHPDLPDAAAIEVFATRLRSGMTAEQLAAGRGTSSDPLKSEVETGPDLFVALSDAVSRRSSVEVVWGAPATRLLMDSGVVGVEARTDSGRLRVTARRGVVLACGGFGYDEELKLNFLRVHPAHFYGSPANTGDGVRMAQAAGAGLWHMNQMYGHPIMHFVDRGGQGLGFNPAIYPSGFSFNSVDGWTGFITTDRHGRRYADEWEQAIPVKHTFQHHMLVYDAQAREFPRVPSFWIFDRRRLDAGPLTSLTTGIPSTPLYDWSPDNRREVEAGWIGQGDTVAEAAAVAGVSDPSAAAQEVVDYNLGCMAGRDAFGRPPHSLVPVDQPPFYCVPLYPGGTNTCGGPRRDERARVLDAFGVPIPGLFGAGELGQALGMLYPSSGCCLTEALAFGQVAAASAMNLGEAPRD